MGDFAKDAHRASVMLGSECDAAESTYSLAAERTNSSDVLYGSFAGNVDLDNAESVTETQVINLADEAIRSRLPEHSRARTTICGRP